MSPEVQVLYLVDPVSPIPRDVDRSVVLVQWYASPSVDVPNPWRRAQRY